VIDSEITERLFHVITLGNTHCIHSFGFAIYFFFRTDVVSTQYRARDDQPSASYLLITIRLLCIESKLIEGAQRKSI
jgi:hypothetical protein